VTVECLAFECYLEDCSASLECMFSKTKSSTQKPHDHCMLQTGMTADSWHRNTNRWLRQSRENIFYSAL